jgi:hypothetical protein
MPYACAGCGEALDPRAVDSCPQCRRPVPADAAPPPRSLPLVDVVLKALFILPFLGLIGFVVAAAGSDARVPLGAEAVADVALFAALTAYPLWSAVMVLRGRRKPAHTPYWAAAVALLWLVGLPGFLGMMSKLADRRGDVLLHSGSDRPDSAKVGSSKETP